MISKLSEIRALSLIVLVPLIPLLGTLAIVSSSQPDLSELKPIAGLRADVPILDWRQLLRTPRSLDAGSTVFAGARIQVLGYMMENDRRISNGESVRDFALLPEAGHLLHPAHRFGDQMIAVHLGGRARIRYEARLLVWASGILRATPGDPAGASPLYALEAAIARPAGREEIRKYFAFRITSLEVGGRFAPAFYWR